MDSWLKLQEKIKDWPSERIKILTEDVTLAIAVLRDALRRLGIEVSLKKAARIVIKNLFEDTVDVQIENGFITEPVLLYLYTASDDDLLQYWEVAVACMVHREAKDLHEVIIDTVVEAAFKYVRNNEGAQIS